VSGKVTWHGQGKTRIKGDVTGYTLVTWPDRTPSLAGTRCALVSGRGTLSRWNEESLDWETVSTSASFQVTVADGGTATSCTKKVCSTTIKDDLFRMKYTAGSVPGGGTVLSNLNGGNVVVKSCPEGVPEGQPSRSLGARRRQRPASGSAASWRARVASIHAVTPVASRQMATLLSTALRRRSQALTLLRVSGC
jgi:hypothetical protein